MTDSAVPMLVSLDLLRTWKFYRYFQFELVEPAEDALADDETYHLILRRGDIQLYFDRTDTDFTSAEHLINSRSCYIEVDDFDDWRNAFARSRMGWKMFYPRLGEVADHPWGRPAFCVVDRDANLIWIVQRDAAPTA
ncbi:hypothetical protein [Brevundimonas sp.]|uniref:hypothetical protein n=1 Tax=Brevundimonas sp. TaxID=1871086 RepID=UPI00273799DF|nr:hypothetical protein [Brevundimonas sp.]MDP3801006.1 hypothetical protein [Brevundimonas sp.]